LRVNIFKNDYYTIAKSKMILRRLGGGNEAYFTRVTFRLYVEEADKEPGMRRVALPTKIAL
jgi:hypothetical protein